MKFEDSPVKPILIQNNDVQLNIDKQEIKVLTHSINEPSAQFPQSQVSTIQEISGIKQLQEPLAQSKIPIIIPNLPQRSTNKDKPELLPP